MKMVEMKSSSPSTQPYIPVGNSSIVYYLDIFICALYSKSYKLKLPFANSRKTCSWFLNFMIIMLQFAHKFVTLPKIIEFRPTC